MGVHSRRQFLAGTLAIGAAAVLPIIPAAAVLPIIPVLPSYSYQWLRDGVVISGATADSYVMTADDADSVIQLRVTDAA